MLFVNCHLTAYCLLPTAHLPQFPGKQLLPQLILNRFENILLNLLLHAFANRNIAIGMNLVTDQAE